MNQNRKGWQSAHAAAVASLAISMTLQNRSSSWPFMAAGETGAATQAQRGGVTGAAAASQTIPAGNHGDNLSRSASK